MNDDRHSPFPHYLDKQTFAVCRDCLIPMLGILSYDAREFCIDHQHKKPEVDLKLCKGL
jgi:hypothetical protein